MGEHTVNNRNLCTIWFLVMDAVENGKLKKYIKHIDQVLEEKIAHHHFEYRGEKYYIMIKRRT